MKTLLLVLLLLTTIGHSQNFKDPQLLVDLSQMVARLQQETKDIVYASPTGIGDGSAANPYSLQAGLMNIKPGQKLVLLAGHYANVSFVASVSGTIAAPILITSYGRVEIDCLNGALIKGSDVTLEGLELYTDSWTGDRFTTTQHGDFSIEGARSVISGCIIHDFGSVNLMSSAVDSRIEGCLIYNIGWGNSSQGHSLYTQNAEGFMQVQNNIFLSGNFTGAYCLYVHGKGGQRGLRGYVFTKNVFFGGKSVIGSSDMKAHDVEFKNNLLVNSTLEIGTSEVNTGQTRTWASPSLDIVDVNVYHTTSANIAISNASMLNNISVSLVGLSPGPYRAYNAQNPKEWFDFNFAGGAINFPMTGWTVAPPIGTAGGTMTQTTTMFPKFGIFYITRR